VGANVKSGPIERGYLTKLKKAGFITTCKDEEGTWIFFTKAGVDLASELSIIICES
jgi:DNA-binding transcriptional ArsR family regulator